MIPKISLAALVACLFSATALAGQTAVHRDTLGKYTLPTTKTVARVEVQRLTLPPGGASGEHVHPGPVVSYVISGRIIVKVKGEAAQSFTAGQTIFEPGNKIIERFDNLSPSVPAVFIADYLLSEDDQGLVKVVK
jgi:quercetin dioxygenase-like cupin family protein